jgi:hypothetical protein
MCDTDTVDVCRVNLFLKLVKWLDFIRKYSLSLFIMKGRHDGFWVQHDGCELCGRIELSGWSM